MGMQSRNELQEQSGNPKNSGQSSAAQTGLFAVFARTHQRMRESTIRATPAFIVNHMTNFVAAAHVAAEILMLWSGHFKFHQSNPKGIARFNAKTLTGNGELQVNPLIDYPNNLWRALRGLPKGEDAWKAVELPKTIEALRSQSGIGAARQIEEAENALNKITCDRDKNRWLIRSTASGFSAWIVGTLTPEKKDTSQDTESDIELYDRSKTSYFAQRGKEAFMLFNPATKRQQIGMGVTLSGIFSTISGMNMVSKSGQGFKAFSRSAGGACTAAAGLSLWFSLTDKKAWERFGLGIAGRLPFIPASIHKMYKEKGHWEYYGGAMGIFQSAALFSSFLGGVRKNPDGTITELKTKRDEDGRIKVTEDRAAKALQAISGSDDAKLLGPSTVVTEINSAKGTLHSQSAMIA
jgi:hypothetical protein